MAKPTPENPPGAEHGSIDQELSKIEELKKDFDAEFSKSEKSGDYGRVLELKKKIDENLATLKARAAAEQAFREAQQVETVESDPQIEIGGKFDFALAVGDRTGDEYRQELTKQGCNIGDHAKDLLMHPDFKKSQPAEREKLRFTRLTVSQLAKRAGPVFEMTLRLKGKGRLTTVELFNAAKEAGLKPVPASVGPELRLAYKKQPPGETLYIGMQPIAGRTAEPKVFGVLRDSDALWLVTGQASVGNMWPSDTQFVFASPE